MVQQGSEPQSAHSDVGPPEDASGRESTSQEGAAPSDRAQELSAPGDPAFRSCPATAAASPHPTGGQRQLQSVGAAGKSPTRSPPHKRLQLQAAHQWTEIGPAGVACQSSAETIPANPLHAPARPFPHAADANGASAWGHDGERSTNVDTSPAAGLMCTDARSEAQTSLRHDQGESCSSERDMPQRAGNAEPGLGPQAEHNLPVSAASFPMEVIDLTADSPMHSVPPLGARADAIASIEPLSQSGSAAAAEALQGQAGQTRRITHSALPKSWVIQDKPPALPVQQSLHRSWGMGQMRRPVGVSGTSGSCCSAEAATSLSHGSEGQACLQPELHRQTRNEGLGKASVQGKADDEPLGLCDDGGSSGSCNIRDPMAELTARGMSIHNLKEVLPEEIRWGQIRLAAAHIGRTGLLSSC